METWTERSEAGADPARLLDRSDSSDESTRAVLRSLRGLSAPSGAKRAVWPAIAAALPMSSAQSAAWALKLGASAKAVLVVPLLAATVLAVAVLPRAPEPLPVPQARAAAAPAVPLVASALPPAIPSVIEPVSVAAAGSPRPAAPVDERLARETAMLTRARAELRTGNAPAAQLTLSRMQRAFGSGALRQERELLTIEAAAAQGNAPAADALARAFLLAHSASPHAPAVRRYLLDR